MPAIAVARCRRIKHRRNAKEIFRLGRHQGKLGITVRTLKTVLFAALLVGGLSVTAERVWLVNAPVYPRFLATDLGNVDAAHLEELRKSACKHDGIEVYPKRGVWILRCGFAYYDGHTYISHTDPFEAYR